MKKSLIFLAFCLLALGAFAQVNIQTDPITSDLHQEIHKSASAGLLRINIRLKDQFDSQEFMRKKSSLTREDRRNILVAELKFFASRTQQNLIESLLTYSQTGEVADIKPLWIANVITCYATPERIYQLATRPDIERIDIDEERVLIESAVFQNLSESYGESGMEIPYNVANVNAPGVWAQGFTGSGVVVALLDSGVNYNHTDLTGNLWTHPDFPYHGWNFVGNNNNPLDDNGHGTHTAGTVAGQGASGTQTGVAPNAQIMALKVMSSDGSATESGVWNAIQFAVEQGADIISMSLGWLHAWNPDRATWRNTMVNVLYSGIIASVAAGNEGDQQASYPIPDNVRTPGDCPAPWLHPDQTLTGRTSAVVCVGAVTSSDTPTGFSGRGPVTWLSVAGYRDYAYNPGIGLIRPDVVAPGVAVKSLSHDSNTGYTTMSGTSMATPCVAGVMALMLSKNSNTEPVLISQILEETAFPLSTVKNNVVGSGRVDALGAVNATGSPGPIYQSHTFHDSAGNGDGNVNPGENILLSLGIINKANQSFSNVNVTIRTNSAFVTITDSIELYGSFNPGELIVKESAFRIVVADNIPNGHAIKFFISASTGPETWRSHFTAYAYTPLLSSGNLIVIDPTGNANNILDPSESTIIQFPVLNKGMMEAVDVQVSLTTSSSFINISNIFSNAGNIAPESLVRANFGVGVSHVAPFGSNVVFTLTVASGVYLYQKDYTLKIGNIIEDFESADFSNFDWIFSGHQPWMISSQDSWEGLYAARSGATGNSQSSQLSLSINVAKADYISFKYLVSSELNCDYLKFYIDNDFMGQWSGEVSWQGVLYPVMPGLRSFRWEYVKNIDLAGGRDGAWVDYVSLPLPLITAVYAGPDASICAGLPHQLQGVAMNGTGLQWTTSGNGTFSNNAIPNPMYTPSAEDIEAEKVILILSAISAGNELIHDILILHIQQQSIAWAGDDTTICLTNTFYTQDAVAAHYTSTTWLSSGDGFFEDTSALRTHYLPGPGDLASMLVTLTLVAHGYEPCGDVTSNITLTFLDLPAAIISGPATICQGTQAILSIELEGAAPWMLTFGPDQQVHSVNESPYSLVVQPNESTVYKIHSLSDGNGCTIVNAGEFTVIVSPLPLAPGIAAIPDTIYYAIEPISTFAIIAGQYATSYEWQIEPAVAGTISASGSSITITWNAGFVGQVKISGKSKNSCGESAMAEIKTFYLQNIVSVNDIHRMSGIRLFPNPSGGIFDVEIKTAKAQQCNFLVFNLLGRMVFNEPCHLSAGTTIISLDLRHLDVGLYVLQIEHAIGMIANKLIISR